MKKIKFTSIIRENDNLIKFKCIEEIDENKYIYDFFYEFNQKNTPSNNALAVSFSCLVGKKNYDEIYIDLELNNNIIHDIKQCNECNVICKKNINSFFEYNKNNSLIINFSGGFDSLALKNIFDKNNIHLVSIDFGGNFIREYNFFKNFNPFIVRTNIRESNLFKKLESKSWQFMGLGTVLYAEKLHSKYYSFGTILEADRDFNCNVTNKILPFSALGLKNFSAINGLTEVATTKIVSLYTPNLVIQSLQSLSNIGTIKRLRKDLLASIFIKNIEIHNLKNFNFGNDYVFDFLLFYFIKIFGINYMQNIIKNIPQEIKIISSKLNLNFYNRVNPKSFITFNNCNLFNIYIQSLFKFNISIYNNNDYYELYIIRETLSKLYNEKNKNFYIKDIF